MATARTTAARRSTGKTTRRAKSRAQAAPKGAATVGDLRRIARAIVTSTSVHDEKRMLTLYADSVESQEAGQMPTYGIEAIKQKTDQWNKMVSDVRWHARNLWCDGQTIIIEWEAQITMRPGGRKVLLN